MTDWISSDGMAMMRAKRRRATVARNAKPRTTGLIVLEISHRMSSARTAARAIVVEKVRADKRLMFDNAVALEEPSLLP